MSIKELFLSKLLIEAQTIHDDKYDYSNVQYKNIDTKVKIVCSIHGEFEQTLYHHVRRKQGCRKCKGTKIRKSKQFSKKQFIDRALSIHGNKYDCSKVNYVNMHTHVCIKCPQHNDFYQKPSNHIFDKNGCPSCGYNTSASEIAWIKSLSLEHLELQKTIIVNKRRFKVDAYDSTSNTIYEFFDYFWHGYPDYFNGEALNPKNGKSFKELYQQTKNKIECLTNAGFTVITK